MDYADKQQLFDALKAARNDNETLWAIASTIALKIQQGNDGKVQTNKADLLSESEVASLFDDPDRARAWWLRNLQGMVEQGNQQAAKTLQDALGIVSASNDIAIHTTDYKHARLDCPHCGEPLDKPILPAIGAHDGNGCDVEAID